MSRWHRVDCSRPRIEVEDGTPKCHSCGQNARLTDQRTLAAAASSDASSLPPDEPPGQFNLWWPRSVKYLDPDPVQTIAKRLSPGEEVHSLHTTPEVVEVASSPGTPVYPERLQPPEFRLLVLKKVGKDYDSPVHLELEVHCVDECPEYETVSYTWAGEDGNAAPQHPVYVGPFWDVLLQTTNCWEMLRFMRPQKQGDSRTLWVDAICINQDDVVERSTQVANMGRIYSRCSRVNVYLGPDVAIPLYALRKKYPRRFPLHQLETGEVAPEFPGPKQQQPGPRGLVTLRGLLGRRYFSRLWVIQELILSCHIVIRVGDVDFWANGAMSNHLSALSSWSWEDTPAPWAQQLSHGGPLAHENELSRLLAMSSQTSAADPRDRVFGLLGLLEQRVPALLGSASPSSLQLRGINSDYSLSCRHVHLGVSSHCLLNSKFPYTLFRARGLSGTEQLDAAFPSWVPDWNSREAWGRLLTVPKFQDGFAKKHIIEHRLYKEQDPNLKDVVIHEFKTSASVAENPWPSGASVCSKTGALHIDLTQCLVLKTKPTRVSQIDGCHVFLVHQELFQVYLLSEYRLDEMALSGREEVFALEVDGNSSVYLVLQPTDASNTSFKLVATCPYVCTASARQTPDEPRGKKPEEDLDLRILQSGNLHDHLRDVHKLLQDGNNPEAFFWELKAAVAAVYPRNREESFHTDKHGLIASMAVRSCLRKDISMAEIFRLYLSLPHDTESGKNMAPPAFMDVYLNCMPQEYQAKVEDDWLLLTVEEKDWEKDYRRFILQRCQIHKFLAEYHWEFHRLTHELPEKHLRYNWYYGRDRYLVDGEEKCRSPYQDTDWASLLGDFSTVYTVVIGETGDEYDTPHPVWKQVDRSGGRVQLRYPMASLIRDLREAGGLFKKVRFSVESLSDAAARTGEEVREMLERAPTEEDKHIWCLADPDETSVLNDLEFRYATGMTGIRSKVKIC